MQVLTAAAQRSRKRPLGVASVLTILNLGHRLGRLTYNSALELFHQALVTLDVIVVLVGGDHWHTDGYRAVSLLKRDINLLLELFHMQACVVPVLNEWQVHVPDHCL